MPYSGSGFAGLSRNTFLLAFSSLFADISTLTYLGFAVARDVVVIGVNFVFCGLYQGIFRSVGKAFASDFVPEPLQASGVGWYSATVGLAQLFASLIAGELWDHVAHAAVFYYGVFSAVVGVMGLLLLMIPHDEIRVASAGRHT